MPVTGYALQQTWHCCFTRYITTEVSNGTILDQFNITGLSNMWYLELT